MLRRAKLAVAGLALISVLIAPGAHGADSRTPALEKVRAYVAPSIVYISIDWSASVYDTHNSRYLQNGQPFDVPFQCTGSVVNPEGYVATAGHCVSLDAEVTDAIKQSAARWAYSNAYYQDTKLTLDDITGFSRDWVLESAAGEQGKADRTVVAAYGIAVGGQRTGVAKPARVIAQSGSDPSGADVALLKFQGRDLPVLELGPNKDPEVGTEVVSIGYPASVDLVTDQTFDPSYKDGSISAIRSVSKGLITVYEVSAAISGGMSGGPTVDLNGRIIGSNDFSINGESQPFNFIEPASLTRELLRQQGVTNKLGSIDIAYRAGLDAYFAGDKGKAMAMFAKVLNDDPSHELAQEFSRKARQLPDKGLPLVVIILIVAALVALAAAAVVFMRRRRTAKAPDEGAVGTCPSCGRSRRPNARFCEDCGFDFHKESVVSQPAPEPSPEPGPES